MQGVFVFDYPACSYAYAARKNKEDKLCPPFATHSMHSSMQPPSFAFSHPVALRSAH